MTTSSNFGAKAWYSGPRGSFSPREFGRVASPGVSSSPSSPSSSVSAGGGLRALHRAFRHFVGGGLRLVGAHLLRGVAVGRALGAGLVVLAVAVVVLVLVIVGIGVAVVAKLQRGQQIMHRVAEFRLIFGEAIEPVEPRADLVFQHRTPQVDHLSRSGGRREAGEALAHQHRQRVR